MRRGWLYLALTAGLAACSGASYTTADANLEAANQRAQRYCSGRDETAQLEQVRHDGDSNIQVYRCVAAATQ